ncbi:MAG: hypothetical protein AAGD25_00345 [Cyanobacteria bacterium P01_F01_bin.150]
MKNRHWLEFTEYASIAGVATGAVASFVAKQALYLSTPLSIALLVGFANRRRVERLNEEKTRISIATLKRKISKQIKLMDQHIQTLPTPEMVGDVRNSTLRHSRDELKQLTTKLHAIQEEMGQYASILDDQNAGGIRDEIQQLQGFYTEIYTSLKFLQQSFDGLDVENKKKDIERLATQVRGESEQIQSRFQSLTDQTQPILAYLQEQVNHLNRQNSAILQQVDANSLKRELDILMDAVADLAPKRELNTVMADVRTLQENQDAQGQSEETLRKQLQTVMQRLQAVPDVPQFRAQIEETLSWKLSDIKKQLRSLPNTDQFESKIKTTLKTELDRINHQLENRSDSPPYKLLFDLHPQLAPRDKSSLPISDSQQVLQDALLSAKQRLIMVWPWSVDMRMDKPLMQSLERFVKKGRQLDIGWCHITSPEEERFLGVINRRWSLDPLHRRSLQRTLQYLLALKRRYPKNFKFRVLGTVENFLVADQSFAVLGIEDRLTPISAAKDISLKLWTSDKSVIQQLIQTFDNTDLASEDIESHWNRAITRYDLGDRAGAMADINQALAINPQYAAAYNMRGIICMDEGNQAAALADFDKALAIDDAQVAAYCNRGFIRSEQGDQYRAIADFSLAIQTEFNHISDKSSNSKLGIAYFYRGLACQKLEDFESAIVDYSEALTCFEASPVIYYHRGITYQSLGYYTNAIEDLELAVALFKQKGSQTNTRRASRHLTQAREALTASSRKVPPLSIPQLNKNPYIPRNSSSDKSQQPTNLPESSKSFSQPAESEGDKVDSPSIDTPPPQESSPTSESLEKSAIPTFLFPDDSRFRPSMIQDMDVKADEQPVANITPSESVGAPSEPVGAPSEPVGAPSELVDIPSELVDSPPEPVGSPPEPVGIPSERPSENHVTPPREHRTRRSREDLDKLVTSTLTNFFDAVDMERLGTQTLDNFFAVVQDSPDATSSLHQHQPEQFSAQNMEESASSSSQVIGKNNEQEHTINAADTLQSPTLNGDAPDQSLVLFGEASFGASNAVPHHGNLHETNEQQSSKDVDVVDKDIESLVSSTLTNFFKDLNPDNIGDPPPNFFEEVSSQEISDETLVNFHQVMDDLSSANDVDDDTDIYSMATIHEEQNIDFSNDRLPGLDDSSIHQKSDIHANDGQPSNNGEDNGVGIEDNLSSFETAPQAPLSMNHFFDETTSEPVGDGTLINFQFVVQEPAPNTSQSASQMAVQDNVSAQGHVPAQDNVPASGNGLNDIAPEPNEFIEAIDSEALGTQTLGNFMEILQDVFITEEPGEEEEEAISTRESMDDNPFYMVETEDPSVHPVNEQLFQTPISTSEKSSMNRNGWHTDSQRDNTIVNLFEAETNGLSVGTETMRDLMTAISDESLGTQTLRDFFEIMSKEKSWGDRVNDASAPSMDNNKHQASSPLNETVNPTEEQLAEALHNTEASTDTTSENVGSADIADQIAEKASASGVSNDKDINLEEDSILFESLNDFSDCF